MCYLIPVEEGQSCFLTNDLWNKGVSTFFKDTSPKMNVIKEIEFELASYDVAVHLIRQ